MLFTRTGVIRSSVATGVPDVPRDTKLGGGGRETGGDVHLEGEQTPQGLTDLHRCSEAHGWGGRGKEAGGGVHLEGEHLPPRKGPTDLHRLSRVPENSWDEVLMVWRDFMLPLVPIINSSIRVCSKLLPKIL